MIKGVMKQIVEVNETECDYFEKIIFIVKPEYKSTPSSVLKGEVDRLSKDAFMSVSKAPQRKNVLLPIIKLLSAAGVGAAAMAVFSNL